MKQKTIFIVAAIGLLLLFALAATFYTNQKKDSANQLAASNQVALMRMHSPTEGKPDAPVVIVEFFDPACGTCRDFYPLVKQMLAGNPDRIRLVLRYAPFHPGSDQVVAMLEGARRQGKFWQALETLFEYQDAWVQNHTANAQAAWEILGRLGLDMERMNKDMNTPDVTQVITQDLADAKTLNVTMTPEYFVNGKPLPSFGYDQLKSLVDQALKDAR
jgi:protein-disulfide isomerase